MSKQRTTDDKAAYHTLALTVFGSLSTVTLAGSGTMAELNWFYVMGATTCVNGMAMNAATNMARYPCG